MNRKIIYIVNPISGTGERTKLLQLIEQENKRKNIGYEIFPSVESGDYSFLKPIIKTENITDVVIAGGDGTVSYVVGSLLDQKIDFGILPCGSGNGLALTAGIAKQHKKAFEAIFNGTAKPIDGFMVNEKFACMLCGLGFDAQVAHDFARQSERGLKTYTKQVIRNFMAARTYSFELVHKGKTLKTDAYFTCIANSNQFGNRVTIAPRASLSDGLLDIVIVTKQNKLSLVLQTIKQLIGWNKLQSEEMIRENKAIIYFQTDKLSVKNLDEAPIHIDGDPCNVVTDLRIKVIPKCFRLIQP
jgi:diacylglycerol kinase (ATP)